MGTWLKINTKWVVECFRSLIWWCAVFAVSNSLAEPALEDDATALASPVMRVSFINPAEYGETFWDRLTELMQQEANARHIQLDVHYAQRNRLQVLDLVRTIVQQEPKPDYLIFVFQAHLGAHLLSLTEAASIPSFSINTNIPAQEMDQIGLPRQKFKLWLGHMFPDEQSAGFTLAQSLVEQAREQPVTGNSVPLSMIAIAGGHDSAASIERLDGLQVFLSAQPNIALAQVVRASWQKEKAREMTEVLLKRYPETRIIWAASDLMALGALEAAETNGRIPGKTIFAGGFDGTAEGLSAISQGRMQATMSGHYTEGARALALLHKHYQGHDFVDSVGTRIRTRLTLIHPDNVSSYLSGRSSSVSAE